MSPLNSNKLTNFHFTTVKTILQSQFTNVQFSFLFFFNLCTVYFTKKCLFFSFFLSFFFFLYAVFNSVQVSFLFLSVLFPLSCTFLFLFSFFFIINCSFTVPFFSNPISSSLRLYLNTVTIGSLPRLFNFNP